MLIRQKDIEILGKITTGTTRVTGDTLRGLTTPHFQKTRNRDTQKRNQGDSWTGRPRATETQDRRTAAIYVGCI